ncbi:MAG: hypothetical protein KME60_24785 [Cyanomargarita calcarea GSE-NOS-MK-12-04C]|uniref:Uncharacterized protein n=1 Tax=Cyanomargarita calcarea GSE-NOS-MK-12-04C TaxID=2839659 RepID=A0A951QRV8_9CYAN|nr:hypothetical protein [Cyanomargarita calcarea GSE-NOS-MK-12-04C]
MQDVNLSVSLDGKSQLPTSINLTQEISLEGAEPALSEQNYSQLVEEIRGIVADKLYASA